MHPSRFISCRGVFPLFLAIFFLSLIHAVPVRSQAPEVIQSGCEYDYPPFCIVHEDGTVDGFSIELLQAAVAATGHEVKFRAGPWAEVKGWLERGEVDALPLVGLTPEREKIFDFTFPYLSMHGAIVVREDTQGISSLEDLQGKQVLTMKDDNAEEFLRREPRDFTIHTRATFEDALKELSQGNYDAVVIQRLVALRLMQILGLTNLRIVESPIEGFRQDFCFAVQKGDNETLEVLNQGLALVIADGTRRRLHAKWFAALQLPAHRKIVIGGDDNFPPFEFLDENGEPTGYNVDLTRAIARESGLDVVIRLGPWAEVRQALKNRDIDALQGMFYSTVRDLVFDFSQPHIVNHCVSVVRKGEGSPPTTVEQLMSKRIVVQKGDIMHDFAIENGLESGLTAVPSQEDALRELLDGKSDCMLGSRMTILYWMKKNRWNNLVLGHKPLLSPEYCYAVANNQTALLAQLSEGLNILEETGEYRRIHEKWMGIDPPYQPDVGAILKYIALVALPLLAILLIVLLWSWSLRKEVARRTEDLRASEKQFRSLVEGAPDAIFVQTDHRFAYVNEAAARLFGAESKEQLLGEPVLERFHPDVRDVVRSRIRVLNEEKKRVPAIEEIYLMMDGSEIPVEVSAVPIVYEGNNGALVFVRDITERKLAEKKMQENERQYRLLAENTLDVIWTMDLDLKFTYVNPAITDLTGYTPDEWIGTRLPDHCDSAHFTHMSGIIEQEIAKGPDHSGTVFETEVRRKNGSTIPVEVHGKVLFGEEGIPLMLQGTARDITERKRAEKERSTLERQLRQAQKMEAIGQLTGGIAHDFNNLLQVINGSTEMAKLDIEREHPAQDFLGEVSKAGERATKLVSQLLMFSRRQIMRPEILDLNEVVADLLKMLGRVIGEHIRLQWVPGRHMGTIQADKGMIEQALMNLCVNARDAMPEGGVLTIETTSVSIDSDYCATHAWAQPGRFAMLSVGDTGFGMDKETLEHIFEPFYTTKETGKGTGLGLATVYGIVRQHEGMINAYSEPGKGTMMKLYFPLSDAEAETVEAEEELVHTGGTETLLLAEDDKMVRDLTRTVLERAGYTVYTANNGAEAVARFKEHSDEIDLVVLDVVMPQIGGREAYDQMCALRPDVKAIFASGYSENAIHTNFVLKEGFTLIQKPYASFQLLQQVRKTLDE